MALGAWVSISLLSVVPVMLSFMGTGCSMAVVGGLHGCWVVNVVRWVQAVVCRLLSALHVVVDWAVVICFINYKTEIMRSDIMSDSPICVSCGS